MNVVVQGLTLKRMKKSVENHIQNTNVDDTLLRPHIFRDRTSNLQGRNCSRAGAIFNSISTRQRKGKEENNRLFWLIFV